VDPDRRPGGALDPGRPPDVVEVAVSVKERDRTAICRGEREQDLVRFVARVDHNRFARVGVRDDRAVALERTDRDRPDERSERSRGHGFTATTVSMSCFSRRSGDAHTFSGDERLSWMSHSSLSGRRCSEANSLRRLFGVKISQRT
jgi:hypothetical protein